jgi:FixJ family two-component response regulator
MADTVLLVDDEAIVLDVLAIALAKKQVEVKTASRGAEALALAAKQSFGCLMVDKNLPDCSGLEVIEKMRALQPTCACILMTGYPNADAIIKAMQLGAVDYLEKPFPNIAIIQQKVLSVLAQQRIVVERDALVKQVDQLQARAGRDDVQDTAQLAVLQQALDATREESRQALDALRSTSRDELEAVTGRLEGVKLRHLRLLTAVRLASAALATLLDAHPHSPEADRALREVRRSLSAALDESSH